jgi:thiosulfate/3-mercaptopyruvate sulfurtransferase
VIPPFADTTFVNEHPDAVLADVRWYLDGRDGQAAFETAHLPAAVWVDLDRQLAATDRPATEGRHPLPTPNAFAAAMGALGISNDTTVIAYDDTGGLTAGRLAVMLRMLGCDAAVLNGGLNAWSGEIETGPGRTPTPATFAAVDWPAERVADEAAIARVVSAGGAVLDARSPERFRGEVAQIDKRPGHIPGARNAPWSAVIDADATVRPADELRDHYRDLGVDGETVAYCGSGVSACMNVLAMEHAGLGTPRLYVASWSGWSADPQREAALGD